MSTEEKAGRKHFAAGDSLTRFSSGSQFELCIDSAAEKHDWKPRVSESHKAVFPGTAIAFEDKYYEVVEIKIQKEEGVSRYCYYLNRWDERFPIRVQFRYSTEECRRLARKARKEARNRQFTALLLVLAPIVGLLPDADQRRIGSSYGITPTRFTFLSSIALLFPGGLALILLLVSMFVPAADAGITVPKSILLLGSYFFLESFLRIYSCMKLEEPMGSLLLSLPVEFFRAIRRTFDPTYQQMRFERMEVKHSRSHPLLNASDQVMEVSGENHDLEIISLLPKPSWTLLTGVNYQGVWYGPVDFQKMQEGETVRYKFLLKKAPEGFVFRTICNYTPEDVRQLYLQQRRRDLGTWVETFAPFWGLLDRGDQTRLKELYDFDGLKYSRWTFLALGALGLTNLIASLANLTAGIGTELDVLLLFPSGYFLLESYTRWKDWKVGQPSGSILGILFRPLAKRLLE